MNLTLSMAVERGSHHGPYQSCGFVDTADLGWQTLEYLSPREDRALLPGTYTYFLEAPRYRALLQDHYWFQIPYQVDEMCHCSTSNHDDLQLG